MERPGLQRRVAEGSTPSIPATTDCRLHLLLIAAPPAAPRFDDHLLRSGHRNANARILIYLYSHSLRLNTTYKTRENTMMISPEAMTPAGVPDPGYGTF